MIDVIYPWKWTVEDEDCERDIRFDSIAKAACNYITPYSTIYINSGTTGNMMVKYLPDIDFTVVTNSIIIADCLYKKNPKVKIIVVGGLLRCRGVCDDERTINLIQQFSFDVCFLTGEGFSVTDGLTNSSQKTSEIHRIVSCNSKRRIVLLPKFKIGDKGQFKTLDVTQVNTLITNCSNGKEPDLLVDFRKIKSLEIVEI